MNKIVLLLCVVFLFGCDDVQHIRFEEIDEQLVMKTGNDLDVSKELLAHNGIEEGSRYLIKNPPMVIKTIREIRGNSAERP